jgi:hypothetical protein
MFKEFKWIHDSDIKYKLLQHSELFLSAIHRHIVLELIKVMVKEISEEVSQAVSFPQDKI